MSDTKPIEYIVDRNPGIMGGEAVFRGTRVPVAALFDYLTAGDSVKVFLDHFPTVEPDQVIALLESLKALALREAVI